MQEEKIALICNGPSAKLVDGLDKTFRVNHWYLSGGECTDWFIGEHSEIVHAAAAYTFSRENKPTIWFPGLSGDAIERNSESLRGCTIRIQKHYQQLPALCRWDSDPRPRRPLTGSLALAVAVGMQPAELYLSGMDLYRHSRGDYVVMRPPDSTDQYQEAYLAGTHGNHSLLADLRYIRNALDAYSGKLICIGSVMKKYFANDYKRWEWYDG
jgi:hypothetical protein